ncbi:MAG TPA: hypothetical protein VGJ44_23060 [Kribbellaceae bacterium]|jgi:hypothetical protein
MPIGPACVRPEGGKGCLPLAPASRRVDLIEPVFSHPTAVTNPLHPTARPAQVVYGGTVDGKPFRTEVTRLPGVKVIHWQGQTIPALVSQYLAYSDGRVAEVALDWFAQADDGAVWYLGEDVREYEDGVVATTEGSWEAGKGAPPAMIMPATPRTGAVYRSENAPGLVFEQDTVLATGRTVTGPSGAVAGAIVVAELQADGARENKVYAPGYGEFSTATEGELEAVSIAVPADTRPGPVPARLTALSRAVRTMYDDVAAGNGSGAAYRSLRKAWRSYRPGGSLLDRQMGRDIALLGRAIGNPEAARAAALRVAQNELDQRLRYVPLATIERARFELWRRQTAVDARAGDAASVSGDVASLRWTWDRVRPAVSAAVARRVDGRLRTAAHAGPRTAARIVAAVRLS